MKVERLTENEIKIVDNPEDIIYLEIIKGMSPEEKSSFDCYRPKSIEHYNRKQREWVAREIYLIGHRPGHGEKVSSSELLEDIETYHNGLRFKVFYTLKYPGLVERFDGSVKI